MNKRSSCVEGFPCQSRGMESDDEEEGTLRARERVFKLKT